MFYTKNIFTADGEKTQVRPNFCTNKPVEGQAQVYDITDNRYQRPQAGLNLNKTLQGCCEVKI